MAVVVADDDTYCSSHCCARHFVDCRCLREVLHAVVGHCRSHTGDIAAPAVDGGSQLEEAVCETNERTHRALTLIAVGIVRMLRMMPVGWGGNVRTRTIITGCVSIKKLSIRNSLWQRLLMSGRWKFVGGRRRHAPVGGERRRSVVGRARRSAVLFGGRRRVRQRSHSVAFAVDA